MQVPSSRPGGQSFEQENLWTQENLGADVEGRVGGAGVAWGGACRWFPRWSHLEAAWGGEGAGRALGVASSGPTPGSLPRPHPSASNRPGLPRFLPG